MLGRNGAALGGRVRGKMAVLTLAAGMVVPGAIVALTPSSAGAQTDPISPIVTQLEEALQPTINTLELDLIGPFGLESTVSCLLETVEGTGGSGPCVDGGL